jgi:hypothetical protein
MFTRLKAPGSAPAARVCYLHIGPHKTGTTSIQHALFRASRALARRGFVYPTLTNPASGHPDESHLALTRAPNFATADLMDAPAWRELDARITGAPAVVLSAEHFSDTLRDGGRYERVTDFFIRRGFRMVVVAYVRDQPAWLNSRYTQDQRNFRSRRSIAEFADLAHARGLLDPEAYLRRPVDDPRVEVRVASFEAAAKEGLVRDFLRIIGAPAPFGFREPEPVNPNIGIKGVFASQEIMRRVGGGVRALPDYPKLYEVFKTLTADRDWRRTPYYGLSQALEALVRDRHRDANDRFARRWFGTDWATLHPPKPRPLAVFDPAAATEAERADVAEVVDRMVELIVASKAAAKTSQSRRPEDPKRAARRARRAARAEPEA